MRLRSGVAIDLGTVNTLVSVAGRGLIIDEPSAIAIDRASGHVAAIGTGHAEGHSGDSVGYPLPGFDLRARR